MGQPDRLLLLSIFMLLGMGLLSVYSASAYHAQQESGHSFALFLKQLIAAVIGLGGLGFLRQLKTCCLAKNNLAFCTRGVGAFIANLAVW